MGDTIENLHKIHRNLKTMLRARGYNLPQSEIDLSFEDFKKRFAFITEEDVSRDNMTTMAENTTTKEKILVFFTDEKLGVGKIRKIGEKIKFLKVKKCIIILRSPKGTTSSAREDLADSSPNHLIEYFHEGELLHNLTENVNVPHHRKLSNSEKEVILAKYKTSGVKLPIQQLTDPISKYYGHEKGDIIEETIRSATANYHISYRTVSDK